MKTPEEIELEKQVARIRRKRRGGGDHTHLCQWLNVIFLILAAVGLVWYFTTSGSRVPALGVIAAGMVFKVVEFFVRFML